MSALHLSSLNKNELSYSLNNAKKRVNELKQEINTVKAEKTALVVIVDSQAAQSRTPKTQRKGFNNFLDHRGTSSGTEKSAAISVLSTIG